MLYYSTNNRTVAVNLQEAVVKGLAPDKGLFMPDHIAQLPTTFFKNLSNKSLSEISAVVANAFFENDINIDDLAKDFRRSRPAKERMSS